MLKFPLEVALDLEMLSLPTSLANPRNLPTLLLYLSFSTEILLHRHLSLQVAQIVPIILSWQLRKYLVLLPTEHLQNAVQVRPDKRTLSHFNLAVSSHSLMLTTVSK